MQTGSAKAAKLNVTIPVHMDESLGAMVQTLVCIARQHS